MFNQVWQREFRCIINASDTVPLCPDNYEDRTYNCRCTGEETLNDLPVDPKVNYMIDSVNVFASTLDKMIYNCGTFQKGTFCNRSIIASSDILYAIPQLSFNGLTGVIAFNQTRPPIGEDHSWICTSTTVKSSLTRLVSGIFPVPLRSKLASLQAYPQIPVSILQPEDTVFGSSFWTFICLYLGWYRSDCLYSSSSASSPSSNPPVSSNAPITGFSLASWWASPWYLVA